MANPSYGKVSMSKKPRSYSDEFKRQAVRRLKSERIAVTQLARELGITPTTLYEWQRRLDDEVADRPIEADSPAEELKRLRREVAQLREDNTILKKFAAYITKESQ